MGREASRGNTQNNVNAFGIYSGKNNAGYDVNFIGNRAGGNNQGNYVTGIGKYAAANNSANYVFAIGKNAGLNNGLSNMVIIASSNIKTFASRVAAQTLITIANGGVAGNTYLYYNSSNGAIEGVQL